jgi:hypothetical protein
MKRDVRQTTKITRSCQASSKGFFLRIIGLSFEAILPPVDP